MRVLVTGGRGFIGRAIVESLSRSHEVLAPTHAELNLTDSVAVDAWFARHRVDAVVHAAAKPGHRAAADPAGVLDSNLRQFFGLVRNRRAFGRFVVVSSGAVYGIQRPIAGVVEDDLDTVVPADGPGLSKYVEALWLAGDRDAVELRPFGVYGPGEAYAIRFISNACCKALLGLPITLRQDRLFSYVRVEDLAAVVERALADSPDRLGAGAYNVTHGAPVSLRDLADRVAAMARTAVPVVVAQAGLGMAYWGDGSRLAESLPDIRFADIDVGLKALLAWYGDRLEQIDRASLETDR